MKIKQVLLVLMLASAISVHAQIDLGITGMPALSRFQVKNQSLSGSFIYPINYGLSLNYHLNRFMFSSGVLHITQGRKLEFEKTTVNNPEGTGEFYDVVFRAQSIMIPVLANYKVIENSQSTLFGGMGIYTGYIYSQEQEQDWESGPHELHSAAGGPSTELNIFDDFYFGINLGIGWQQKISDHLSFQLRPNFLYQLRAEQGQANTDFTNRMITWGLDLGVYYRLN